MKNSRNAWNSKYTIDDIYTLKLSQYIDEHDDHWRHYIYFHMIRLYLTWSVNIFYIIFVVMSWKFPMLSTTNKTVLPAFRACIRKCVYKKTKIFRLFTEDSYEAPENSGLWLIRKCVLYIFFGGKSAVKTGDFWPNCLQFSIRYCLNNRQLHNMFII